MILTTLFTGIIDIRAGSATVIDANVGTTLTIVLGAIGGIPAKKHAAIRSLVFNIGTATVVFLIFPVMFWSILDIFEF